MKLGLLFIFSTGLLLPIAASGGGSPPPIVAQAKFGTLGFGVDAVRKVTESLDVRAGVNVFNVDRSRSKSFGGIAYDAGVDLRSVSLLADWRPKQNAFYVTGGLVVNNNEVSAKALPAGQVDIGGVAVMGATLDTNLSFDKLAPYLGVGYRKPSRKTGLSFSFEAGVLYQQKPNVSLSVQDPSGVLTLADVERERQEILEDTEKLRFWPAVNVGLAYRF